MARKTLWSAHVDDWKDCTRCPLHTVRSNVVLARGSIPCDILFVGEAPGRSEDALGKPFVGPAGILLDEMIEDALSGIVLGFATE
jgi:uracil-DNA glycosylase